MQIKRFIAAGVAGTLAVSAWAQTASPAPSKPLNLTLPAHSVADIEAGRVPAHAASAPSVARPASRIAAHPADRATAAQPGVYYGDTSGRPAREDRAEAMACDDSTYNQTQVHGSVGMGVVAGDHISGNYQTGTVHLSKALGSCDHPTGGVSISIGVGQGDFRGGRYRRH